MCIEYTDKYCGLLTLEHLPQPEKGEQSLFEKALF